MYRIIYYFLSITLLVMITVKLEGQTTNQIFHIPDSISAKSEYSQGNSSAENLTDGNPLTSWRSRRNGGPNPNNTEWIKLEYDSPTKIDTLYLSSTHHQQRPSDPKVFYFEGTNNQIQWDTLYQSDDAIKFSTASQEVKFPLSKTGAYQYYRLVITKNVATYTRNTALSEIRLKGPAKNATQSQEEIVSYTYAINVPGTTSYLKGAIDQGISKLEFSQLNTSDHNDWEFIFDSKDGYHLIRNINGKFLWFDPISGMSLLRSSSNPETEPSSFKWEVHQIGINLYSIINQVNVGENNASFSLEHGGVNEWEIQFNPISTNPEAPYVPPHKLKADWQINKFDWKKGDKTTVNPDDPSNNWEQQFYVKPYQEAASFRSNPYYDSRLPEIARDKVDDADYQWEEGWELIKHNLGYYMPKYSGQNQSEGEEILGVNLPTAIPFIVMYNRFQGIIRVLALVDNNSANSRIDTKISFLGNNRTQMLGLTTGRALNVEAIETTSVTSRLAFTGINIKSWTYADFPVAFDPCTATELSNMAVEFIQYIEAKTVLTGRSMGVEIPAGQDADFGTEFLFGTSTPDQLGHAVFPSVDKLKAASYSNFGELTLPDSKKNPGSHLSAIAGIIGGEVGLFGPGFGITETAGKWAVTNSGLATGVAAGANLLNYTGFLISGPTPASLELPPPRPYISYSELHLTGKTKTSTSPRETILLSVPGSKQAHNGPQHSAKSLQSAPYAAAPMYNENLGIFGLVNQPTLNLHVEWESIDYKVSHYRGKSVPNQGGSNCVRKKANGFPKQIQGNNLTFRAKLANYINYTLNSDLPIDWSKTEIGLAIRVQSKLNPLNSQIIGLGNIDNQKALNELLMQEFRIDIPTVTPNFNAFEVGEPVDFLIYDDNSDDLKEFYGYATGYRSDFFFTENFDPHYIGANSIVPYIQRGEIENTLNNLKFDLLVYAKVAYHATRRDGKQIVNLIQTAYPFNINLYCAKNETRGEFYYYKNCENGGQIKNEITIKNRASIALGSVFDLGAKEYSYTSFNSMPATKEAPYGDKNGFRVGPKDLVSFCSGSGAYQSNTYPTSNFNAAIPPNFSSNGTQNRQFIQPEPLDESTSIQVNVYPNPTSGQVNFRFDLPDSRELNLVLYNAVGQQVMTIANGYMDSGTQQISADLSNFTPGIYIYRLTTKTGEQVSGRIIIQ